MQKINFIIDLIAFIDFALLTLTGFLDHYILTPHSRGAIFWSMTRDELGDIHFVLALVFITFVVIYVYLHWSWIKAMFMRKSSTTGNTGPDSCACRTA